MSNPDEVFLNFYHFVAAQPDTDPKLRSRYTLIGRVLDKLTAGLSHAFEVDVNLVRQRPEEDFLLCVEVRLSLFTCVAPLPLVAKLAFELPPYSSHPSSGDHLAKLERRIVETVMCATLADSIAGLARMGKDEDVKEAIARIVKIAG